ncbi:hypothetical protein BCR41DRAFT_228265 [Lobosporangium transversale]|uniref:Beta-mannosidase Ig-fold domain-containing protein n=1 Tax=Lobosporangium transversale TaxID=64571 RepID=A0A1Y2G6A9_9FUNG|nr:hypothetical protein BCR41DRAFT_228265 [Lobosporangium transversale]ORY97117.1 hypothetical protein BCR41DRAFT_228265 [Lobosporangium transversale]|eukprot:XP_021875650.1 hypothetical protein BCR41DRAFT_228265 [Lobosporangium transversale]
MGALYWQLNDIWPAPTWSSIEHCGRWKPLHNFMKHSFADILVSGYQLAGEHSLHIHVSNGRPVTVKGTLYIRSYNIQSGELKEQPKTCFSIKCYKEYAMKVEPSLLRVDNDDATCVIFATAIITSEGSMSEQTFEMLPLPFPCRDAFPLESLVGDPKIVVEAMKVETNEEGYYVHITLRSSELAGFVWLEWESQGEEIEGYFEENAFWILPGGSGHTLFHGKDKKNLKYIQEHNLHIKSLWDVLQCSRLLEDDILSETII